MWVYKPVEKSAGIFSRAIAWTAWATKTLHLTLIKKTYSCHRSFTDTRSLRGSGPVEVCFGSGMKGTIKRAKKARGRRTARDRSISKAGPGKHLGAHVLVTGVRCRCHHFFFSLWVSLCPRIARLSRDPLLFGPELSGPRTQFMSMHVLIPACIEFQLQRLRTR